MGKEEFERRLREFFQEHDERKLKIVPKIVRKLYPHEELIMNHLHQRYNTGLARNVSEEELRDEDRIRREREGEIEPAAETSEASSEEDEEMKEESDVEAPEEDEENEEDEEKKK